MTGAVLHELVDAAGEEWPGRPAIGDGGQVLTYAEVRSASVRLAAWFVDRGVRRGDRVVISEAAGPWLAPAIFGLSRVGAVAVPLGARTPAVTVAHVLDDAEPVLAIGGPVVTAAADHRGLASEGPAALREVSRTWRATPPPTTILAVDPAWFIYTSGSTGMPKAVVSTHGQVVFAAHAIQQVLGYQADDVVFCPLPLSFDYGLYQVLLATVSGARLELGSAEDAGRALLNRLHDTAATVFPAVPSLASTLTRLLQRPGARRPRLRLLTNTGAAMPPDVAAALRDQIPGLGVQLMYGLTECKRATIMPRDGDLARPGSSGHALPGTEVFVVDSAGHRLPPGHTGEIVVRGPNVMSGYWRRPESSAERFRLVDGLFPQLHTGDFGRLDGDGYLYFEGRRDDVYKERGTRVSSIEVEAAATRVRGVRAACAVPPSDGGDGATLVVASALSPAQVLAALLDQVEENKAPRRCLVLPALPTTPNGKIDRIGLARLVAEARDA